MEADLPHRGIPTAIKAILAVALAARDLPSAPERATAAAELRTRLDALGTRAPGCDDNRRFLAHLSKQAPHLFTFLATAAKHGVDGLDYLAARARGPPRTRPRPRHPPRLSAGPPT